MATLIDWNKELARKGHRVILSGVPVAMHCHHYNINLHKMLEDTLGDRGALLLFKAAEEAIYTAFRSIMAQYKKIGTMNSKFELASTIYQNCGLGVIHFQKIGPKGGRIISLSSHHVTGWLAKHGSRETPGCHFSRGWIAGVLEAIYGRPTGTYSVVEKECKMMRNETCTFVVKER